jgi:predicted dehydrogenase
MFNFAFIGCGLMANWHAQELLRSGHVRAVAAVDPLLSHAESFRQRYAPEAAVYPTIEALLAAPPARLDGVVVVTPHAAHAAIARTALDAGLHVLVDKPMVTSVADAYDLWHRVKRSGKLLGITYQAPYTFNFGYLASARDGGDLGAIHAAAGYISQGWLAPTRNTWRQDPAISGGGFAYDTGAHLLNALMWLVNAPVVDVAAVLDNRGSPVDVTGSVTMRFSTGAVAAITFAGDAPSLDSRLTLFTERYAITTDAYGSRLEMTGRGGERFHPPVPFAEGRGTPHANFVDALLGREPLAVGVRYGVLLSALMDAIYASAKAGTAVRVEPVPDSL